MTDHGEHRDDESPDEAPASEPAPTDDRAAGGVEPALHTVHQESPLEEPAELEVVLLGDEAGDPLIGTLVSERYRVDALLGQGGMGNVYRAEHIHMRKAVALKVLHGEMTALPEVVARFEREAVAAGRIDHPNVAQATDFGRLDTGRFYLVLEYVEGVSLRERLTDEPLESREALAIVGQIAEALAAAHDAGIVHRDLKPDNIMLVPREGESDLVKVLDFGIAKLTTDEVGTGQLTRSGSVFGTPDYMAPEQAAGQPVDHRADLYALGVVLFRLLAGHPPFEAEEVSEVLAMQITHPPPPLPDTVPAEVEALTLQLLEKDPERRPTSAHAVVERVLECMGGSPLTTARTRVRIASEAGAALHATATSDSESRGGQTGWRRPIRVGDASVPLWGLLGAGGLATAFVAWSLASGGTSDTHANADRARVPGRASDAPTLPTQSVSPEVEKLIALAFAGDPNALSALEEVPSSRRTVRHWLAIARGRFKTQRVAEGLAAYREALMRDPSVADDPSVLKHLRSAADEPDTAAQALHIAADSLGAKGADLLYDVWVRTRARTPTTELAQELVYRKDVRNQASPALVFVLDLRAAQSCDDYKKLLPRAAQHGDVRSLQLLKVHKYKNDCELPVEALDAAITAVMERPETTKF